MRRRRRSQHAICNNRAGSVEPSTAGNVRAAELRRQKDDAGGGCRLVLRSTERIEETAARSTVARAFAQPPATSFADAALTRRREARAMLHSATTAVSCAMRAPPDSSGAHNELVRALVSADRPSADTSPTIVPPIGDPPGVDELGFNTNVQLSGVAFRARSGSVWGAVEMGHETGVGVAQ